MLQSVLVKFNIFDIFHRFVKNVVLMKYTTDLNTFYYLFFSVRRPVPARRGHERAHGRRKSPACKRNAGRLQDKGTAPMLYRRKH